MGEQKVCLCFCEPTNERNYKKKQRNERNTKNFLLGVKKKMVIYNKRLTDNTYSNPTS